ncbi:hypothetical protein B296_00018206 [Ensete ventricosum]|uniref:Uncharacterized protein n=1 Tax=Ensete ventricosum TaxID=4639 RepID=A0A426YWF5_ENSVE|nr:hypothetical protein B296_00018206 [Ensete ventricosum]
MPLRRWQGWPWAGRWRLPPSKHAANSRSLRPGRWRPPYAAWSWAVSPCGLAAASRARGWPPLASYCSCGWLPLAGGLAAADRPFVGEPWLQPTTPL